MYFLPDPNYIFALGQLFFFGKIKTKLVLIVKKIST